MIDPTDQERTAIRAAVRPVAEVMDEIGWATRLGELSEQQVLTLIEAAVDGFQEAMREFASADSAADLEVPF